MRVSDELWQRAGEIIEETQSMPRLGQKEKPKVEVYKDLVVIRFEKYTLGNTSLQDLHSTIDSLAEEDSYDVNTGEGFRILVGGEV